MENLLIFYYYLIILFNNFVTIFIYNFCEHNNFEFFKYFDSFMFDDT